MQAGSTEVLAEYGMPQKEKSKRIQTSLPESTYEDVLYACSMYGMTVKSFAAEAIAEKAYAILEKLRNCKSQEQVVKLPPEAAKQFRYFLTHPEIFSGAEKRFEELAKDVQFSPECKVK